MLNGYRVFITLTARNTEQYPYVLFCTDILRNNAQRRMS